MNRRSILALGSALLCACASAPKPAPQQPASVEPGTTVTVQKTRVRKEMPPASGPRRDVSFPSIARAQTASGLELNTVQLLPELPVVQIKLVVRSGSASDPEKVPGLAQLTAAMLKEGSSKRNSAKLAEAIDFLGADLHVASDTDSVVIDMHALSEHFQEALELVAEVATKPAFSQQELDKLRKRELARLQLRTQSPHFLATREFSKALYGKHAYAHVDTTPEVVKRVKRNDLMTWHRRHFGPNNAFLVVVGNVTPDQVKSAADSAFKGWAKVSVPPAVQAEPPARETRDVILVDRPKSVQSVIYYGNLALPRQHADYIPLLVANQVLGGSAASRLFMDLREKRSLTYGAYSDVDERVQVAPFNAFASVRNEVTAEAMAAFSEHLDRIVREPPSEAELADAKRYLVDRFPLRIETPEKVAALVSQQRLYGLEDDYWDKFGEQIERVTPDAALQAAQKYIRPDKGIIVVVGEAAAVKPALERYGSITVVDVEGELVVKSDAAAAEPAGAKPAVPVKPAAAGPSAQSKEN
jgi:zinc protease